MPADASSGPQVPRANQPHAVEFFDAQFKRQVRAREFALNPFEQLALRYAVGSVLDLGCGLGNLSLELARHGHEVVAVDASGTAIDHIATVASAENLDVHPIEAAIGNYHIDRSYDTIIAIGLVMFFSRERATQLLREIQDRVRPSGRAIVNVLVEGTTFLDMFEPGAYYLFGRDEVEGRFAGWRILEARHDEFAAVAYRLKVFSTVIAEKPGIAPPGLGVGTGDAVR